MVKKLVGYFDCVMIELGVAVIVWPLPFHACFLLMEPETLFSTCVIIDNLMILIIVAIHVILAVM